MEITKELLQNAKRFDVEIEPSTRKNKKLDIYKDGNYLFSIGDSRYNDYHSYKKIDKELAEKKRMAYYNRHYKDLSKPLSRGFFSWYILWN
jgi:hypothetical protein